MTLEQAFTNFQILETKRLTLRPLRITDVDAFFEIKSDPEVTIRYAHEPATSLEETRNWVEQRLIDHQNRNAIFWIFTLKDNDWAIGSCCFWNFDPTFHSAEIGYELNRKYWSKSITSEALPVIVDYGFAEMDLHRIEGLPSVKNEPSRKLLLRLGFKLEGTFRERLYFRGEYEDQLIFGLLKKEWISRTPSTPS